ncbi:carboxylic ester hydrolase [Colletotrichum scovillei]|uniref:Carboxylic ester hydrolase n=1 Tax=Colletotrichum scovillei TaxID=1209932 RepID=A0A9P7UB74_9PEZI|nr:carboxylic ester hydrolase [Colletotrichum scovillei]KAG7065381.1 carboxylic ester hydrolase [Colletotrichum scovillei]KAG7067984.1 carboxylic ester hydrolase [Colletotrichum scovillei]
MRNAMPLGNNPPMSYPRRRVPSELFFHNGISECSPDLIIVNNRNKKVSNDRMTCTAIHCQLTWYCTTTVPATPFWRIVRSPREAMSSSEDTRRISFVMLSASTSKTAETD